jgi:nicotinamide-nucleotide amidase
MTAMVPDDTQLTELAVALAEKMLAEGTRVATAESCTGGWIAKVITDLPGSSDWFGYGIVSYSNAAKQELLGVSASTLVNHGAVSEPVVREMAEGAIRRGGADLAVAVSGVAGPFGGTPAKPVGTVWFAWARIDNAGLRSDAECHHFGGDREAVRRQTVAVALKGLMES